MEKAKRVVKFTGNIGIVVDGGIHAENVPISIDVLKHKAQWQRSRVANRAAAKARANSVRAKEEAMGKASGERAATRASIVMATTGHQGRELEQV